MRGKLPAYVSQDRHGLYHFWARIPQKFRLHFNGKAEIKRSLGTDSYREAVKLARSLRAQMDQRMAELETGVFKARVLVLEGKKTVTLPDGAEQTITARIERDEPATEAEKNEHKDFLLRQLDREAAFKLDQARQEALHRAKLTQPDPNPQRSDARATGTARARYPAICCDSGIHQGQKSESALETPFSLAG
jgi:hypothetical protein